MITARLSASAQGRCDTAEGAFNDALSNLQSQIYSVNEGLRLDNEQFSMKETCRLIRDALSPNGLKEAYPGSVVPSLVTIKEFVIAHC